MSHEKTGVNRRQFLHALGVLAGAGALTVGAGPRAEAGVLKLNGRAEPLITIDDGWRQALATQYLDGAPSIFVRPLQDGLEVWEGVAGGYMVVESSRQTLLESSASAPSPFRDVAGDVAYLGPGEYYAVASDAGVNLVNGAVVEPRELRAMSIEATSQIRDILVPSVIPEAPISALSGGGLPQVTAAQVKSRVPYYSLITSSTLYPNTAGTCGWVAGSIITRYWHAMFPTRQLLPSKFRSDTNMTKTPDFSVYLKNSKANGTWARTVKDQLIWNAKKQGAPHSSAWALGNIGMWNELNAGRPFILFGNLPIDQKKKKGGHAVVAYGQTKGGELITHYGWAGYNNIVLNGGLVGSNTKFRLT